MSIRVYNTLSKQKEPFETVQPGKVGIYLCGPTVYKPSHIGHAVGPVIFDAIARYLKHKGYEVTWIVNVTDVDDKIIDEAARQGRSMQDIARQVEADYERCLLALGVRSVSAFPRATEHIGEIIELIGRLVAKGAAYVVNGDVYFDHAAAKDYGKLSGRRAEEQLVGMRALAGEAKRHPADFALWKSAKPGEPSWDSPWGKGRPGWHIECSAMSMSMLGETFDIHGGGMDLIFPHHENEIAQSETATGKQFARYWLHNGLTRIATKAPSGEVKAEKMSKSLGNIRTIASLLEDFAGQTIRYFVLSTHYRRPLDFSDEQLAAAGKALENFYRLFEDIERLAKVDVYAVTADIEAAAEAAAGDAQRKLLEDVRAGKARFFEEMDDDFNTAGAIAALHGMANSALQLASAVMQGQQQAESAGNALAVAGATIVELGRIIGLFEARPKPKTAGPDDAAIQKLIEDRAAARKARNFARADEIRKQLAEQGITLEDTPGGTIWRRG